MLSSNSWRTLCSLRALGSPNWLLMNRKASQTNVMFSVNTMNGVSYAKKDTWRNKTIRKAWEKEIQTSFSNAVFLRNYCTGQIKMNCWKCKQPLENDPAFFCLACKVVQPPGKGTSYFKIMDWWVPSVISHEYFTSQSLNRIGSHNTFSFQWLYVHSGYT